MLNVKEIKASDTLVLRQQILRPLLTSADCFIEGDELESTIHLGCFLDDQLVGIVSLYKRVNDSISDDSAYQIRMMACNDRFRGQGIGTALLISAIGRVKATGTHLIWANARVSAIGFYTNASFEIMGDVFDIPSVGPHYLIYKNIA